MVDWFGVEKRKRRRALWTQIAHEHGGEFHLAKGFWKRKSERIEATAAGVPFVLDTYVVSSGESSQTYSRVAARLARGPGVRMQIHKRGLLSAIGNMLFDDHPLGYAEFDAAFIVRSEQVAVTRRIVTERATQLLLATFRDGRLTCKEDRIELITRGLWSEERRLRDAVAIVGELASRDLYGSQALRAVEGGVFGANERGWPIVEVATSARVTIGAIDHEGQLVMLALSSDPTVAEPMQLEIVEGAARDAYRMSAFPPGAHVALRSIGTGVLVVTEKGMHFRWRDLELDPLRLRAGADLLGAMAAGHDASVYR